MPSRLLNQMKKMNFSEKDFINEWPPPLLETREKESKLNKKTDKDSSEYDAAYKPPTKKARIQQPKSSTGESTVDIADIGLARWYRVQRKLGFHLSSLGTNPNTMLFIMARSDKGQQYLQDEAERLKCLLDAAEGKDPQLSAALATYKERLSDLPTAQAYIDEAVDLDETNREYRWYRHRIERQLVIQKSQQEYILKLQEIAKPLTLKVPQKVDHRHVDDLSFHEFYQCYALCRKPVVITGLAERMTTCQWNLEHIKKVAGECSVMVRRTVPQSVEWARLEDSHQIQVGDFIDGLENQKDMSLEKKSYLFDWSLPLHCPELANELVIPKYFAGDFLQRTLPGTLYHDSWPSLFVAPAGLHSDLHVDAFGSNFWMALFQGRKRWVFYSPEDVPLLYPTYHHSLDPVFDVDLTQPDLNNHPLLALATPLECVLEPGEVLFVPAGSPHRVENLEPSLAISANFVDLSNLEQVKQELEVNSLIDSRACELLKQLKSPSFCSKMDSNVKDMPWRTFKQWPKDYIEHDITATNC